MIRKIIKQGTDTYTFSIPKEWIKRNKLMKGDEIIVDFHKNNMIVSSENILKIKKEINLFFNESYNLETIRRVLFAFYKSGIDEISIKFLEDVKKSDIFEVLENQFLGYQIIEEKTDFVRIKDLSSYSDDVCVFIKRIFFILLEMMNFPNTRDSLRQYNNNAMKLLNFATRSINKKNQLDAFELQYYFSTIDFLNRVRKTLWFIAFETKKNVFLNNIDLCNQIKFFFELVMRNYLKFSEKSVVDFIKLRREIFSKINQLEEEKSKCLFSRFVVILNDIIDFNETLLVFENYKKYVRSDGFLDSK